MKIVLKKILSNTAKDSKVKLYHLFTTCFLDTDYLATYSSEEKAEEGVKKFLEDFGYKGYRKSKHSLCWTSPESSRDFYVSISVLDENASGPKDK